MSRALGVDYGERRVGLALSDQALMIAQAYETLPNRGALGAVVEALCQVIQREEVSHVVVGWPLRLNGKEGIQTRKVAKLIEALSAQVEVPITRWDERLSTVSAERALLEGGLRRDARKQKVDQVAACFILQGWLDARRQAEPS